MKSLKLFNEGDLDGAVAAAIEDVKSKPLDIGFRLILAELLSFSGDLARADKHLETVTLQDPKTGLMAAALRQLIRAEITRQECFTQGRVPEFLGEPDALCELHLKLFLARREGKLEETSALLEEIESLRPVVRGSVDGEAFEGLRDLDDYVSCFAEVLTSTGKYYWIPFQRIESIQFEKPKQPRDLLWREARMVVTDGPDGVVYLPTIYATTTPQDDLRMRLGQATDWRGNEGEAIYGVGQRTWLLGDNEKGILEISSIEFEVAN